MQLWSNGMLDTMKNGVVIDVIFGRLLCNEDSLCASLGESVIIACITRKVVLFERSACFTQ